jgi:hypothetical protein
MMIRMLFSQAGTAPGSQNGYTAGMELVNEVAY